MKASVKEGSKPTPRKRAARAAKVVDKDLAQLAVALESGKAMRLSPPETPEPQRDPTMWSKLFGMWA